MLDNNCTPTSGAYMRGRVACLIPTIFLVAAVSIGSAVAQSKDLESDATSRVLSAIQHYRDKTSYTQAKMIVHRKDWQRTMEMNGWTQGMKKSLIRFVAPARDAGSASLKLNNEMWSYSPKINRVVKIPPSMMTQSWMGSDFSYNDLAKADEIIEQYTHRTIGTEDREGKAVVIIEAIPHDNAPVVWGKEVLKIREDDLILEHLFYDQDMKLVKKMVTREIRELGGKIFPTVMRMESLEEKEKWTEIIHLAADFGLELGTEVFTLSNLRNPRR
jgi:outer membrane lipoprotein-sorting protein